MNLYSFDKVRYTFKKRTYLTEFKSCTINVSGHEDLTSSSISDKSQKLACLAAIGELLERERLFTHTDLRKQTKKEVNEAYSIIRKENIILDGVYETNYKTSTIDSSSLASHTSSYDCIMNAFEEFVERQSYLLNYLSKTPCKKIDLKGNGKYERIFRLFPDSELSFYNISISEKIYVILAKAFYEDRFYVGLGCSTEIDTAIFKCIKELIQCKEVYENPNLEISELSGMNLSDYGRIFFSIEPIKLWRAYDYLDLEKETIDYKDLNDQEFNIHEIALELNKKYQMNPMIINMGSARKNKLHKVVRVIDLKWFKSLMVKFYIPEELEHIEKVTGKKLDRNCTFIPFP